MENNCDTYVRKPYPKIQVEKKSEVYADILLDLYAGKRSEMTAIGTYSYQYSILKHSNPPAAALIECISISEMKHFQILSELILLLGSKPKLLSPSFKQRRRQSYSWWTGEYINYDNDYEKVLNGNIANEKNAVEDYKKAIKVISDPGIVSVLERIILDEEKHIEVFEALKKEFDEIKK